MAVIGACAALRANRISREALITSERAWIELQTLEFIEDLDWRNQTDGQIGIKLVAKNVGKTPALAVWIEIEIMAGRPLPDDGIRRYNELARKHREKPVPREWGKPFSLPDMRRK